MARTPSLRHWSEGEAPLPRQRHRRGEQRPVRRGGEGAVHAELVGEVRVRAGADGGDYVHELEVVGEAARGADADDVLHAVFLK